MPKETFSLDGVSCDTVGIKLQRAPAFEGIQPLLISQQVPGRNGVLLFDTGAYANRMGKASCFALSGDDVQKQIDKITKYLFEKAGYRKLECSYDPDHYWMALVINGPILDNRMRKLNPFDIQFSCLPQRFVKNSPTDISIRSNDTIDNNHSGEAVPIVKLQASGEGRIAINESTIWVHSASTNLFIDCETGNAFDADGNANKKIECRQFPKLHPGRNHIDYTGNISGVKLTPRWWDK